MFQIIYLKLILRKSRHLVPDPLLGRLSRQLVGANLVGHDVMLLVTDKLQPGKIIFVKPWSKSESKPLSKQAPKLNKSPPKQDLQDL